MPSEFHSENAKNPLEMDAKPRHTSSTRARTRPDLVHPSQQNEYIDELEGLLLQIQSKERKAGLEFESARRTVIEENEKLRTLLRRIGITDAEVEKDLSNSNKIAAPD